MKRKLAFYTLARFEFTDDLRMRIGEILGHPKVPASQDECRQFMQTHGDQVLKALTLPAEPKTTTLLEA